MRRKEHDITKGMFTGPIAGLQAFAYTVLAWFTITVEAFLRRNFGERYFTRSNFIVGFIVITVLALLNGIAEATSFGFLAGSLGIGGLDLGLGFKYVMLLYLLVGAYHFWIIWINAQVGYPQHSLYSGVSHLQPIGKIIVAFLNPVIAKLVIPIGKVTLPSQLYTVLKASLKTSPPIEDVERFTKYWLEPFVLMTIAGWASGIVSLWLYFGAFSMMLYTRMGYDLARASELDVEDSIIEATFQKEDLEARKNRRRRIAVVLDSFRQRVEEEPEYLEHLKDENPEVFEALEELDIDLSSPQFTESSTL